MLLGNKFYDVLKYVALIFLPALNVLYIGLGQLWGFPNTAEVVSTIALVDTFLGALLQISSKSYNNSAVAVDGYLSSTGVDPDTGHPNLALTVTTDPKELLSGKTARLKIGTPPPPVVSGK